MVKHEVMVRKSRHRAMSENDGNMCPTDSKLESSIDAKPIAGSWGYKSISRVAKQRVEQLETQVMTCTEDQLPDFSLEPRIPTQVISLDVDQPLVVAEMRDGVSEVVEVSRDANLVNNTPSIMTTCNDAPVIDDYKQTEPESVSRAQDERPKLPFSLNGRLVGTRHYGPAIIQIIKKPTNVVVFNDDVPLAENGAPVVVSNDDVPPPEVVASTCVLL